MGAVTSRCSPWAYWARRKQAQLAIATAEIAENMQRAQDAIEFHEATVRACVARMERANARKDDQTLLVEERKCLKAETDLQREYERQALCLEKERILRETRRVESMVNMNTALAPLLNQVTTREQMAVMERHADQLERAKEDLDRIADTMQEDQVEDTGVEMMRLSSPGGTGSSGQRQRMIEHAKLRLEQLKNGGVVGGLGGAVRTPSSMDNTNRKREEVALTIVDEEDEEEEHESEPAPPIQGSQQERKRYIQADEVEDELELDLDVDERAHAPVSSSWTAGRHSGIHEHETQALRAVLKGST